MPLCLLDKPDGQIISGDLKMITKMDPIKVFYSYSHEDEYLRRELFNHLSDLKNQGLIEDWHDRNIGPGQDWQNKIDEHLESADIILLLVSSDFIKSNYIRDVEILRSIQRHEADEAIIISIFLRAVDCKDASFLKFQGLPTDAVPVMSWEKMDEAFADIAKGIRNVVDKLSIKANQYICRNKNKSPVSLGSSECYLLLNANDDFSARIRETLLEKLG